MALRKTGHFLTKAEILGVGVFSPLSIRETLCESGRCIDAFKMRKRVLKKRGRVLMRVSSVRGTGGGPLLRRGEGGFLSRGGFLRTLWISLRTLTPRRPSLCLPESSWSMESLRQEFARE